MGVWVEQCRALSRRDGKCAPEEGISTSAGLWPEKMVSWGTALDTPGARIPFEIRPRVLVFADNALLASADMWLVRFEPGCGRAGVSPARRTGHGCSGRRGDLVLGLSFVEVAGHAAAVGELP